MQTKGKDIDYEKEARESRNSAVVALIIGLLLIPTAALLIFAAGASGLGGPDNWNWTTFIVFLVLGGIAGLTSIILLISAFMSFSRHAELKGHIKNPVRKETEETEEADDL